ncbi:sulfatase [Haloferax volcanii DSM 14919]|uniref:Sulfatase n=1 Tax=Haloferax lucentense (strain DSM 14919 / JCM 9276 / NCIMB 13854 / Aa 2.2) TaxID=1230452 RepID=M0GWU7_HALL2|nr:sulfatase [Haloferax lucentense]ELZ75339.1 sulfatase [Haloferax lucentense DSM 14919]
MKTKPENVVLLVIDSLRADHLSCYGYERQTSPFIDSLAENGLKFEHAYSTAPWTVPAHGSLFTGELPSYHGSHRKSKTFKNSSDQSLAGLLSDEGYTTAGFSANPWLSPEFNFDTGFDHYSYLSPQPPFPNDDVYPENDKANLSSASGLLEIMSWMIDGNPLKRACNGFWKAYMDMGFVKTNDMTEAISDYVDENPESNNFIFANYMDVHDPHIDPVLSVREKRYYQKSSTKAPRTSNRIFPLVGKKVNFQTEPENPERARDLYDQSIREVDAGIEQLFDNISDQLNLDESLIIILGDHGECMGEHRYWGHGTYLHDELIQVPLIIDLPNSVSSESADQDAPVSLLALFDLIRSMSDESCDNESLVDSLGREPLYTECLGPRPNMEGKASETGYRGVIDAGWKLVRDRDTNKLSLEQVTSWPSDMTEDEAREHLQELEQDRWNKKATDVADGEGEISSATESRLSDLGYL